MDGPAKFTSFQGPISGVGGLSQHPPDATGTLSLNSPVDLHTISTIAKPTVKIATLCSEAIQHCLQTVIRLRGRAIALQAGNRSRSLSPHPTPKAAEIKPTTAQDGIQQGAASGASTMRHGSVNNDEIYEAGGRPSNAIHEQTPSDVNTAVPGQQVGPWEENTTEFNTVAVDRNHVNLLERSDSEAETVVLDGKQEASEGSILGKPIKNDDNSDIDGSQSSKINGFHRSSENGGNSDHGSDRPSLKRKRTSTQGLPTKENAPLSNLSSAVSSPAAQPPSWQASDSDSDQTRSTPPLEDGIQDEHAKSRELAAPPTLDDQGRKKRGRSDPISHAVHGKERRDTRIATHPHISRRRSDSPPSQRHRRAQSERSVDFPDRNKQKKAPPSLVIETRRKVSEDTPGHSDGSSSVHSHPQLKKLPSIDHTAMSPAKISMKKNRDRNGRTLLARACALDFTEAKKWLKERPQDIDVPDNAGNTPLQIASLEGLADVVRLLLDAGCDTTCINIDMDTPLIDAVENGHLEVVQLLLEAGLDARQSNAKGEEPLDLVNPEHDDYEGIRAALSAVKERSVLRRPSEDQNAQHRDNDMSSVGASAASPTDGHTGNSPPPLGLGARRRTARSQQTQDRFLWINPTPAILREACGRGDLPVVSHIIGMRPDVGTDAVILAARGGHDVVLGILIAIGQLEHDPDPVVSDEFKPGYNTPMLAAIGRGHIPVIRLLLCQRGFNPMRRVFKGLPYYELASQRLGPDWEVEYALLKNAYEDCRQKRGRWSNDSSPRKPRAKKPDATRSSKAPSSSSNKRQSSSSSKTAPEPDTKQERSQKKPSNKHLRISDETKDPATISDRESKPSGPPEPKPEVARSVSDAGVGTSKHSDVGKPKRKLLSRNDLNSDQDSKRKASLSMDPATQKQQRRQSGDSTPLEQQKQKRRKLSVSSTSVPKVGIESSNETHSSKGDPGKKRPRLSLSPQPHLPQGESSADVVKKKKKRRVDSESDAIVKQEPQRSDSFVTTGPAMVANMIASPEQVASPSEPPRRAPVANMGGSSSSPVTKSTTEPTSHSGTRSPMSGVEKTHQQIPTKPAGAAETSVSVPDQHERGSQIVQADSEAESRRMADLERLQRLQAVQKEEERKKLIQREEEALKEQQRQHEEEERRLMHLEELTRKRVEQERLRHAEQERRRAEHEERERQRRIRLQEEEQQQLRAALPNSLRRAAELSPEKARQPHEVRRWLPLYTVTTREIDPGCNENMADERWIANVQAAPILAVQDLDLSQCGSFILSSFP